MTCRAKEIDRAHCSHSTREAKQKKTNKKNQGSPIKSRQYSRVCTGHVIPYTYLQMCEGLRIKKISFGRTSSAGLLFFLVPGGHDFFRSLQLPLVPRRPIVHLRCKGPYDSLRMLTGSPPQSRPWLRTLESRP